MNKQSFSTNKQGYICLGNCQAYISEEEYKNGLTACGNNTCNHRGKPFVRGNKCDSCGTTYPQGETHHC